ncbi:MAG: type II toxin-antitoxin system prevent-host-death family antitoxin [Rhodocyclaceae bacterium]|jgi:prevent-host-death family protein|nr:type II toxin-antitoxin system prevent-host-death family antitoxin [Rhodocyclaceae bacterium]
MQSVPIYQLKNELSRFIALVERGEEIAVTRRGEEVARLVPSRKVENDRLAEIRRAREKLSAVPAFDERELVAEGRKW